MRHHSKEDVAWIDKIQILFSFRIFINRNNIVNWEKYKQAPVAGSVFQLLPSYTTTGPVLMTDRKQSENCHLHLGPPAPPSCHVNTTSVCHCCVT